MDESTRAFAREFENLTGHEPFPWQSKLYARFVENDLPTSCLIPTGLGKTNILAVWLAALANGVNVPRRLVYVVNRRTVVDQTTTEAEKLQTKAKAKDIDLAISTLRGQFADNQAWCADPSRPAIIVGTVDMIGSRLLFGGYRIGFKSRPLHAGFLGQDVLLVHDEAHLEPAFQTLVEAIELEQRNGERTANLPWPKLRVMQLSATARCDNPRGSGGVLALTNEDRTHPVAKRRIEAAKSLCLHPCDDARNQIADDIVARALQHKNSGDAVLVFVRSVKDALDILGKLREECPARAIGLTGTLRGLERDKLVRNPVFLRFMPESDRPEDVPPVEGTVYLVCTSAGEVGVNLSADQMVCDLSTLDSMIQRLGRVNRFGDGDAMIDVVHPVEFDENEPPSRARKYTLDFLRQLPLSPVSKGGPGVTAYDASPVALGERMASLSADERKAAFAPAPTILPTTDMLFDAWAMTTIRQSMPGRPSLAPYLHGVAEWEPAVTQVAWREEVKVVSTDGMRERHPPQELLEDYPLRPHELLRDRSDRVFGELQKLATKHPQLRVWVVNDQTLDVDIPLLAELADPSVTQQAGKKSLIARIENNTVLLPPNAGGLNDGMLVGDGDFDQTQDYDVADLNTDIEKRIRLYSDDEDYTERTRGMRLVRSLELESQNDDGVAQQTWDWYKRKPFEDARTAQKPVRWDVHIEDVERETDRIVTKLALPEDVARAVRLAAKLHDHGKRRKRFQSMLGNRAYPVLTLAKSGPIGAKLRETYRHEFGSLADAMEDPEFQILSPDMRDIVLHLIAAHHGRARPHFPSSEVFDQDSGRTQTDAVNLACEVPRRFARLQRKFGRWGLAYLESLLRAADWAASASPSSFHVEVKEVAS